MTATAIPAVIDNEDQLDDVMAIPPQALVEMMQRIEGDIIILGIGGKMGATLGFQAVKAIQAAKVKKKVIGVSRFSDKAAKATIEKMGMRRFPATCWNATRSPSCRRSPTSSSWPARSSAPPRTSRPPGR